MKVQNNTSFAVIAISWHKTYGYGKNVTVDSLSTSEIPGPFLGEMGGGDCHLALPDITISCHEGPDNDDNYHVSEGIQCVLGTDEQGITIRHHSEELVIG